MKEPTWPKFKLAHERECWKKTTRATNKEEWRRNIIRGASRWPTCPTHGHELVLEQYGNVHSPMTDLRCPSYDAFGWAFHDEED